ncbi:MAG: DmsE family decaheme c-type cytochrome [bacterium]|nr:DmsE family decaheme c-type cytochrome [bacterium]
MRRALLVLVAALAACGPGTGPGMTPMKAEPVPPPDPAAFAGPEVCAACHPDWNESYLATPHAGVLDDPARPPEQRACEACHGPGQAHVDGGGGEAGNLQTFAETEPARERAAPCLRCHAADPALYHFDGSAHAAAEVACTDCHDPHGGIGRLMLKATDPIPEPLRGPSFRAREVTTALCQHCHPAVRSQFALPEHHKVPEGVMSCTDCHQPHGSTDHALLRDTGQTTCVRCHGEVEGPFVFEHIGLTLEGCGGCHEPHGSVNRHLLRFQQVAQLCYQCHAGTPASHRQPSYRDCTSCHVAIHGSNSDPRFLEP